MSGIVRIDITFTGAPLLKKKPLGRPYFRAARGPLILPNHLLSWISLLQTTVRSMWVTEKRPLSGIMQRSLSPFFSIPEYMSSSMMR